MLLTKDKITNCCFDEVLKAWKGSTDSFPTFLTDLSKEKQSENEDYIKTISLQFQKMIQNYPLHPIGKKRWKKKFFHFLDEVLSSEDVLGIHTYMSSEDLSSFINEIKIFLRSVRQFSPELDLEGIGQAIRNYIVYAMFNVMNGIAPRFSSAAFGYSMLYPFTDNYIDSNSITEAEKLVYNVMIRNKILGNTVCPQNIHSEKTCKLLDAIESEYPRDSFPFLYELLIMMLDAQEKSISQQNCSYILSEDERLHISIYKGGVSVLIDRILVQKDLNEADLIFYLGFGFFLQLADDLQDIGTDSANLSNQTLFSGCTNILEREKLVNKMLHFVNELSQDYSPNNILFKNFVLYNCYQLIFTSVYGSKEFFSEAYLLCFEKLLPISPSFLMNSQKTKLAVSKESDEKTMKKYMKMLDELIL